MDQEGSSSRIKMLNQTELTGVAAKDQRCYFADGCQSYQARAETHESYRLNHKILASSGNKSTVFSGVEILSGLV